LESNHFEQLADVWLGINYQFKDDDEYPVLLGFTELSVVEKQFAKNSNFKSYMFGFTTYKSIVPVVFSLTIGYKFNQSRFIEQQKFRPGNLLLFKAQGFAANY